MRQPFLLGTDMYRGQYETWNPAYSSFVILKATEGVTYQDPTMNKFIADMAMEVPDNCPFIGFYHYARAENNSPELEVDNYLNAIEPHIGNCMMALDFEESSLLIDNKDEWTLKWCNLVHTRTGATPMLYVSASYIPKFPRTLEKYPLWVAHYTKAPKTYGYKPTMWQFTAEPFDLDIFYGTPADMVRLIKGV